MKFTVLNQKQAVEYKPDGRAVLIGITDPDTQPVSYTGTYVEVLPLQFHDMDKTYAGYKTIDPEDAKKILELVLRHEEVLGEVVVHCGAGISRSSAVAAALSKILTGCDGQFFQPPFVPNRLVYSTILYEHFGTVGG